MDLVLVGEDAVHALAVDQGERRLVQPLELDGAGLADEVLDHAQEAVLGRTEGLGVHLLKGSEASLHRLRVQADDPADGQVEVTRRPRVHRLEPAEIDPRILRENKAHRLRQPIDAFFEAVLVNADDPAVRLNRLALLARIRAATGQVADFSKIAG